MAVARLTLLAATICAVSCTAFAQPDGDRPAAERFGLGLAALRDEEYSRAFDDFAWVVRNCTGTDLGERALLTLAALELDPRNPQRRPDVAAELAAIQIGTTGASAWANEVAETLYVLALDLGATPPSGAVRGLPTAPPPPVQLPPRGESYAPCEGAQRRQFRSDSLALPSLPGVAAATQLMRLRRDSLAWAATVSSREARIDSLVAEIERIRRTLRP